MARKQQTGYFPHDINARNSSKLIRLRMKHGAEGYGVYFMILERLRDEDGYSSPTDYDMIAFDLHVDTELVRTVVEDFGLFRKSEDGTRFYSSGFLSPHGGEGRRARPTLRGGTQGHTGAVAP